MADPAYPITQYFDTVNPTYGPHNAVDFAAPEGTPIFAVGDGEVIRADDTDRTGGLRIDIEMPGQLEVGYAHLSRMLVKPGDRVKKGQIIGYTGRSGASSTGAHLHFSLKKAGREIDPLNLFDPFTGDGSGPLGSSNPSYTTPEGARRVPVQADGNCPVGFHRVDDGFFGILGSSDSYACEEDTGLGQVGAFFGQTGKFIFDGSNWVRLFALTGGVLLAAGGFRMVLSATGIVSTPTMPKVGIGPVSVGG